MYRLFFNLYGGHDPRVNVLIYRNISDAEANSLNQTATQKNIVKDNKIAFKVEDGKSYQIDRDLYTFIYTGRVDKKISKIVKYAYLKKEEANSIIEQIKSEKDIVFEESNVDDIKSFLKEEPVRDIRKARPINSTFEIKELIKKSNFLINQKDKREKDIAARNKDTDKKDLVKKDFGEEEHFTSQEKMDASEFLLTLKNEKLYNSVKKDYQNYFKPENKRSPELKEKLKVSLKRFFSEIDDFIDEDRVKDALINYIIKVRLTNDPKMYNFIKKAYEDRKEYKSSLKEMSSTGTGAFMSPGSGEGMATKYAFKYKKSPKTKKSKNVKDTNLYENADLYLQYKRLFKKELPQK